MKKILNAWYEMTVIPAIILGCITAIGQTIFDLGLNGVFQCSMKEAIFAFFLFLTLMSIEDLYKWSKNWWIALDELDSLPY